MAANISTTGYVFLLSFGIVAVALTLLLSLGGPRDLNTFDQSNEWDRQLVSWEHDRLTGLAKGLASAAAGFVTSLLVAVLSDGLKPAVSTLQIVGCFLGVVGSLMVAAQLQLQARSMARRHGLG